MAQGVDMGSVRILSSTIGVQLAFLVLFLLTGSAISAHGQYQYQELHDFGTPVGLSGPILDSSGNLYATTSLTDEVFELVMPGDALQVLYTFQGPPDGQEPRAPLVFDRAGNLYGTTLRGGAYNAGTVFMLSPSSGGQWRERVLYSFTGGADGGQPQAAVLLDNAGHLYGTTTAGGRYGQGVVYRLNIAAFPAAVVLHSFGATGTVVADTSGNLYGATYAGGAHGEGTVYKLSPLQASFGWAETIFYSFTGGDDGGNPLGGVVFGPGGNLFGAAVGGGDGCIGGCGAIFELTPQPGGNWSESVAYAFTGATGANPVGPVTFNSAGHLFGVTTFKGAYGTGNVFELTPTSDGQWTETTLYSFNDILFLTSNGGLVLDGDGNLYGTYNSDDPAAVYELIAP
jgi:uncharacterized repeat protein (TIGR03803 family)